MADFDINAVVNQIVGKAAGDNDVLKGLMDNPAKTIENMTGVDIPDEQIDAVVKKMGGIQGMVEEFTSSDGKGVGGIIENLESTVADTLGNGDLAGEAENILGGILGDKK